MSAAWGRMTDAPSDYVSLRIRHDGTCTERVVRDGVVIGERELDSVPENWPSGNQP